MLPASSSCGESEFMAIRIPQLALASMLVGDREGLAIAGIRFGLSGHAVDVVPHLVEERAHEQETPSPFAAELEEPTYIVALRFESHCLNQPLFSPWDERGLNARPRVEFDDSGIVIAA